MIDWIARVTVPAAPEIEDAVESAVFLSESTGSVVHDSRDLVIREVYFDSSEAREKGVLLLEGIPDLTIEYLEVERLDWVASYEQQLEAIDVGRRFVVAPDERLFRDDGRIRIVVPQEQAFGTGSHESTRLCIERLEEIELEGCRGLDVGSGSGILAIAMVRLGAREVVAFDNDLEAMPALQSNIVRNDAGPGRIRPFCGTLDALRGNQFDVVTVNILADVIRLLMPELRRVVVPGGSLVLSGVLETQRDEVVAAAEHAGFTLASERIDGEWWGGRMKR